MTFQKMDTHKIRERQDFVPEESIIIDTEHTLEQLSNRFQTVRDGLPELIKNSKDHYARHNIRNKEERQIIVLISKDKNHLGVMDFAGAKLEDFEGWREWSSRTANRRNLALDIEAGYGNGGKSFMVRGCNKIASMCGYTGYKINKWGFINDDPSLRYRAGIFKDENNKELKEFEDYNPWKVLNSEIQEFGITAEDLPEPARELFKNRKSFTLVKLMGVKDWQNKASLAQHRIISQMPNDLMDHAQASLTIETCNVWVQIGKNLLWPEPLQVSQLEPFEGLEDIPPIYVPDILIDPLTEDEVRLSIRNKEHNVLIIKSSKHNLRLSDRLKPRNVIRLKNERNIVANWSIADLVPIPSSSFLYGELRCDLLTEEYLTGPDRSHLVERPLTRALKHWVTIKLSEIAKQIQRIQSTTTTEEEKTTASETLNKLRELMKKYLGKEDEGVGNHEGGKGIEESGTEIGSNKGNRIKKPKKKNDHGTCIDEIVLEWIGAKIKIATGSVIPIIVKCYQNINGKRLSVSKVPLILCADSKGIVDFIGETSIKGLAHGTTNIFFETEDGKIKSNTIEVNVLEVISLDINPPQKILKQGEQIKLDIKPHKYDNTIITDLLYEAHVDEGEMGKISRYGVFTAGGQEGTATVRIRFGPQDNQISTCLIGISNERQEGDSGSSGSGVPLILLCGINDVPDSGELPEGERTHPGGEDYTTIIDWDPIWKGIIWINPTSLESKKVRTRGHRLLKISSSTYQEFLALKCFEILKRLKVKESFGNESKTNLQFLQALADAEMGTSEFLEVAYKLVSSLVEEEQEVNDAE